MPSSPDDMIGKLLTRLTPRLIGVILVIAIVVTAGVMVIAVFSDAEIDFFGFRINARPQAENPGTGTTVMSADQFIAMLPGRVRGAVEDSRNKIESELYQSDQKSIRIRELEEIVSKAEDEFKNINEELNKLTLEIDRLRALSEKSKDKFLNWIMLLEEELVRWDGSINTEIRVEEKTEVFRLIQILLRRLGYFSGDIDADPIRSRDALVDYKKRKDFKNENLWAVVTQSTIVAMVRDYADILLKELRD
jgi:hypothetical protein